MMGKIKVIQLVEDLKRGGLENVVSMLAHKLDREKYDIQIWCLARGGVIARELQDDGFTVRILGITSYYNPFNLLRVARQLRASNVTVVHAHGFFCQVFGAFSAALARVPVRLIHVHTTLGQLVFRDVIKHRITSWFLDKIIFVCQAAYDEAQRIGCGAKDKSVVIHNGVADGGQRPPSAHEPKNIITIVASLYAHKGHTFLLQAVKEVMGHFPDIQLWIIGQGPLREALQRQAEELGITEHVTFWGEQKNTGDFLGQSKIFVLPSLREGLSLAIAGAMACRLPVVASRTGGTPEILKDGVTGYLVEPKDPRGLAEKIALLLSDENKRKQMGEAARMAFEEKFTAKIMMGRIEQLYEDLLHAKVRSSLKRSMAN